MEVYDYFFPKTKIWEELITFTFKYISMTWPITSANTQFIFKGIVQGWQTKNLTYLLCFKMLQEQKLGMAAPCFFPVCRPWASRTLADFTCCLQTKPEQEKRYYACLCIHLEVWRSSTTQPIVNMVSSHAENTIK